MPLRKLPDLTLFRGDTSSIRYRVTDHVGAPRDLTGWSFLLTFASRQDPPDATTQTGQVAADMTEAATGWIGFPRTALDLAVGRHWFDIQSTDPAGGKQTFGIGVAEVFQDITKT